ncbi:sucrose-6-phosphate hydrolase (Sucrase) [Vibrio orientalis CIP 102891 = ATCC 33934]|uniref:Sucrose-6-phosphate hydrolase n=1 Tax=Vibrio orientalis CIP 102891 = ATCC 33934 TaxID=675816 RepID=C9QL35_VIBOR|nr:glycoside hydrolase family 32 protein [Vibrio orientalis]EEX91515.1 sucrose-6-phosphate hydrolase [Vibrio orientalis CIP 102891 = ATCC 33934]EGU47386.1 sucrose-6-phosphate hydrolase (Sucrase) [Vibrio orientalis CIP 102891 = ATCC 33934]
MQEQKYKTINMASELDNEKFEKIKSKSTFRPLFHISPPHGLLNDPNGFCYFNNKYHLFYQWFPFDTYHGMKHWMHLTSDDLLTWQEHGSKITPLEQYESHGAYSGGALVENNQSYLFYTGNIKRGNERDANQCLAILDNNNQVTKHPDNPVITSVPEGYTGHVRDPKIIKHDNQYFMLLGAQRESDLKGEIIIYQSDDLLDWHYKGPLDIQIDGEFLEAYMYECPDLLEVDGHDVLIFSPQGVTADGTRFHNKFNVIYCLGQVNFDQLTFKVTHWDELDRGFDFYAPQTMANAPKQQTLIAWAGTDDHLPSEEHGWINCLTLPRTLAVEQQRLLQKPSIVTTAAVRKHEKIGHLITNQGVELEELSFSLNVNNLNKDNHLKISLNTPSGKELTFSINNNTITLNREHYDHHQDDWKYGCKREHQTDYDIKDIHLICDQSIIEIYINNGRDVFTCLFFPTQEEHQLNISTEKNAQLDTQLTYLTI